MERVREQLGWAPEERRVCSSLIIRIPVLSTATASITAISSQNTQVGQRWCSTICQVSPAASRRAPTATVNYPLALFRRVVSCSRWVWVSCANVACQNALIQRRYSTYRSGGSSSDHPRSPSRRRPAPRRPDRSRLDPLDSLAIDIEFVKLN
jgi:hypothetical protein